MINRQHIRLVVSDIDGTLINSGLEITQATIDEVRRVMDQGIYFGVASGRAVRSIGELLEPMRINAPVIGSNGAVIANLDDDNALYTAVMDVDQVASSLRVVLKYDVYRVVCDTADGWLYQGGTPGVKAEENDVPSSLRRMVDDLPDYVERHRPAVYKVVIYAEESELVPMEADLAEIAGIEVTSSWVRNREIIARGINKGSSLRILAERLGVKREEVLAIGDNRNDLEMIDWAGIGVAMANATPEVIEAADWTTTSNDEDGVANALRRYVPEASYLRSYGSAVGRE